MPPAAPTASPPAPAPAPAEQSAPAPPRRPPPPAPATPPRRAEARVRAEPKRSSGRPIALIAGGALALAVVLVLAFVVFGGGSSGSKGASTIASSSSHETATAHAKAHTKTTPKSRPQAPPPAETTVAVLNGTETTNLAHRISAELQQNGYSQATPLDGRPPGANQVTVVEYSAGQQAAAEGVARSLSGAQVHPLETAVAPLAGSSQVVVIVGANTAEKAQ
jgi:hypothetical protein